MRLSTVAVWFVLAGVSVAQQGADASAAKLDTVRTLHAEFAKVRDRVQGLMEEMRKVERGSDKQKELAAQLGELRGGLASPQKAFTDAFSASDWTKFDPKADSSLLKDGLPGIARDTDSPQKAIAASKLYLEHFADDRSADMIRGNALPMALLADGKVSDAIAQLREAIAKADGNANKMRATLTLGDVMAAQGDVEAATKTYAEAEALADEGAMRYVTLRKELVGKPAPDVDTKNWIGAEPKSLKSLAGKVVLVDFWATWCGPCRMVMPAVDEMYRKHHAEGLEVIGVTRFYANGYMPANKEQMQQGGESVKGLTEASFPEHVTTFRTNTGISYPFAIGVEEDFKNYHVSGIPTLAVVGRDGNIALITVGSGSEGLLKFAVKNLLAKK